MLNVQPETKSLEDIKDIQDELEMLEMVLTHQSGVTSNMKEAFREAYGKHMPFDDAYKLERDLAACSKTIEHPLGEIHRMQGQASRLYTSMNHLMDLKQKHASAIEARFAREQADDTATQGQTVLVFTIVTVIFLPLSFIAAFLALDIADFPHNADGSQQMSLAYASKYVFGVGLGVALAFVLGVVVVLNFVYLTNLVSFKATPEGDKEDTPVPEVQKVGTMDSTAPMDVKAPRKIFGRWRADKLKQRQVSDA